MQQGRAYGAAARVDDSIYMFGGLNGGPYVDTVSKSNYIYRAILAGL